ncbi:MAG TPA: rhodanese-like domain-containing protein [Longimicrobium sp.]|nr:rhodanese-like domain-containing protein [Longimicrobium sp.]
MSGRAPRAHRLLAIAAATLGALALVAGGAGATRQGVDVVALAREVEAEADHVTARELAAWIRDGREGLRIVDVRTPAEFADYAIPTAENLSLTALTRAAIRPDETVVLYSEGGAHAAQGWFLLRARGVKRVYFLREGLYEWLTQVMTPVLPDGASAADRAAFDSAAELSRYFGGVPRAGGGASVDGDASAALPGASAEGGSAAAVRRVRRRGC